MELAPMNAHSTQVMDDDSVVASMYPSDEEVPSHRARAMFQRRSVWGFRATIGFIVAGCFLVLLRPVQEGLESRTGSQAVHKPDIISEVVIQSDGKGENCSKLGENCYGTKCCSIPGTQCYLKKDKWATCRVACNPGPDPVDANSDHWSCTTLGERAPGPAPPPNFA
eukprot:CAMPEP_0172709934 /NCGR_PEP_ID=MMETSP1074-20121228/55358_1 /TAXON_ID=2916 /ORGANISM="Ceratium fusus, Strain PA161109" /LENGTH=166 /DNA_ID=CAMNT_0013533259 /DNA_START=60 /DNA_END=557 /DNA_ORIENTATION=-